MTTATKYTTKDYRNGFEHGRAAAQGANLDLLETARAILLRLELELHDKPDATFPCRAMLPDLAAAITKAEAR